MLPACCFSLFYSFCRSLNDSTGSNSGSTTSTEDFIIIDLLKQRGVEEQMEKKNGEEIDFDISNGWI